MKFYVPNHTLLDPAFAEERLRRDRDERHSSVSVKATSPRLARNMPKACKVALDRPSAKRRAERKSRITLAKVP
jgi:hypothetical protein